MDMRRRAAVCADDRLRSIERKLPERLIAEVASKRRSIQRGAQAVLLPCPHDPRIADSVVEGPFFIVECSHDISDEKDHRAQYLGEGPSQGTKVRDAFSGGTHDF